MTLALFCDNKRPSAVCQQKFRTALTLNYLYGLNSFKFGEVNVCADDTSISYSSDAVTNISDPVNEDLDRLKNWLESNKLSLNVAKTQTMLIGS